MIRNEDHSENNTTHEVMSLIRNPQIAAVLRQYRLFKELDSFQLLLISD